MQFSQNPPCSPSIIYSIAGQLLGTEPLFETPRTQPWHPKHGSSFPCSLRAALQDSTSSPVCPSCCSVTSPLKSLHLQGLPSLIPLEEFCSKPLSECGNFSQNTFSPTLLLFSWGDFPSFAFHPLPCLPSHDAALDKIPQPTAPCGNFSLEFSPRGRRGWQCPLESPVTRWCFTAADVLHSIAESTNMFLQSLSLLNCKEQAPNPTG